ncbi:MAG TPA: HAD family hydrolase [Acidimicrobiales bacterium]|nr:HAD family hydrolase [Acidimicrobiales bacterium]
MGRRSLIEVIGLDGDDTLWHSEQLFVDTQARFRELLAPHVDLDEATLDARLVEVERGNLARFGYGVKAFTLSLIETALDVTGGDLPGKDVQAILDLGKYLLDHPVEQLDRVVDLGKYLLDHPVQLLDGVAEAVDALTDRYRVMVVTKGDLIHQESKVARSGMAELFWHVEIVSEKDEGGYRRALDRLRIDPATFVMVGNSVRSDVLPVLAIGGRAVHIPYHVTWELEEAEVLPEHAFPVLASIAELPACIDALDAQ